MDATAQEARMREAWRKEVVNTVERWLFDTPSFEIYGGGAGLFDYGSLGCDIETNVLAFWRQHMLGMKCTSVSPEVVLKASGHVDKLTDLSVKDEKTHRADHLLKDYCNEKAAELRHVLAVLDDLFSCAAQGIFVNFKKLYYQNGNKLMGLQISPRQALFYAG